LQFGSGLLALTQERLLACDPKTQQWREWALAVDQSLRLQDHGGVGNLELHDGARLAQWLIT
jgi:ATP-binding cassette subfamily B protein